MSSDYLYQSVPDYSETRKQLRHAGYFDDAMVSLAESARAAARSGVTLTVNVDGDKPRYETTPFRGVGREKLMTVIAILDHFGVNYRLESRYLPVLKEAAQCAENVDRIWDARAERDDLKQARRNGATMIRVSGTDVEEITDRHRRDIQGLRLVVVCNDDPELLLRVRGKAAVIETDNPEQAHQWLFAPEPEADRELAQRPGGVEVEVRALAQPGDVQRALDSGAGVVGVRVAWTADRQLVVYYGPGLGDDTVAQQVGARTLSQLQSPIDGEPGVEVVPFDEVAALISEHGALLEVMIDSGPSWTDAEVAAFVESIGVRLHGFRKPCRLASFDHRVWQAAAAGNLPGHRVAMIDSDRLDKARLGPGYRGDIPAAARAAGATMLCVNDVDAAFLAQAGVMPVILSADDRAGVRRAMALGVKLFATRSPEQVFAAAADFVSLDRERNHGSGDIPAGAAAVSWSTPIDGWSRADVERMLEHDAAEYRVQVRLTPDGVPILCPPQGMPQWALTADGEIRIPPYELAQAHGAVSLEDVVRLVAGRPGVLVVDMPIESGQEAPRQRWGQRSNRQHKKIAREVVAATLGILNQHDVQYSLTSTSQSPEVMDAIARSGPFFYGLGMPAMRPFLDSTMNPHLEPLPTVQRNCIWWQYVGGLDETGTARKMGIPSGDVRDLTHKALSAMIERRAAWIATPETERAGVGWYQRPDTTAHAVNQCGPLMVQDIGEQTGRRDIGVLQASGLAGVKVSEVEGALRKPGEPIRRAQYLTDVAKAEALLLMWGKELDAADSRSGDGVSVVVFERGFHGMGHTYRLVRHVDPDGKVRVERRDLGKGEIEDDFTAPEDGSEVLGLFLDKQGYPGEVPDAGGAVRLRGDEDFKVGRSGRFDEGLRSELGERILDDFQAVTDTDPSDRRCRALAAADEAQLRRGMARLAQGGSAEGRWLRAEYGDLSSQESAAYLASLSATRRYALADTALPLFADVMINILAEDRAAANVEVDLGRANTPEQEEDSVPVGTDMDTIHAMARDPAGEQAIRGAARLLGSAIQTAAEAAFLDGDSNADIVRRTGIPLHTVELAHSKRGASLLLELIHARQVLDAARQNEPERFTAAYDELTADEAVVFEARYSKLKSVAETARDTDLTERAVLDLLWRAIRRMTRVLSTGEPSPDRVAQATVNRCLRVDRERVDRVAERLVPRFREVFTHRYLMGDSATATAAALDISRRLVIDELSKAVKKLADLLDADAGLGPGSDHAESAVVAVSDGDGADDPDEPVSDRGERIPVDGHEPHDAGPGKKWSLTGVAQRFRGNSFVAPIPQDSEFFAAEMRAQQRLADSKFALHYALLPPNSMHMTVCDGLNQSQVNRADWPAWLAAAPDIPSSSVRILERLASARLDIPRDITMRVTDLKDMKETFGIFLEPKDAETADKLWTFRRQLKDLLQLSSNDFQDYRFHSSLGYRLVKPIGSEQQEIDELQREIRSYFTGAAETVLIDPVAFSIFDDMLAFPQLKVF